MKRTMSLLICLLVMAVTATTARAQGITLKGGLSYGNVSNTGVLPGTVQGRTGFAAGLSLVSTQRLIGVGVEALYAQRGVESSTGTSSRKLDYIDVPVFLRVSIPMPVTPFAYAGPQASFELRCRTETAVCPDTDRPMRSYAAIIGAGVSFGSKPMISIEGRYIYGLTDLNLSTITSADNYRTRSFLGMVGFRI
jgi:hypothetical protein